MLSISSQALVFCNQHEQAEELSRMLLENGLPTAFISGALSQEERCSLMLQMRRFDLRVLITTDLLSRGVDFGRLTLVIHMSLPRELSTYLHRVGRTGRFGTVGVSVLLLSENDVPRAEELLQSMRATVRPYPSHLPRCSRSLPTKSPCGLLAHQSAMQLTCPRMWLLAAR